MFLERAGFLPPIFTRSSHEILFDRAIYLFILITPFPNDKLLDSPKLKEFADDNFRLGENARQFSKRVENTVGKGEIARSEQFLLFPQCFQKTCPANTWKPGLVWERVESIEWEF